MDKKQLNEISLDSLFKGVLSIFFGGKLIKGVASRAAMKDPKVKQKMKEVRKELEEFEELLQQHKDIRRS